MAMAVPLAIEGGALLAPEIAAGAAVAAPMAASEAAMVAGGIGSGALAAYKGTKAVVKEIGEVKKVGTGLYNLGKFGVHAGKASAHMVSSKFSGKHNSHLQESNKGSHRITRDDLKDHIALMNAKNKA